MAQRIMSAQGDKQFLITVTNQHNSNESTIAEDFGVAVSRQTNPGHSLRNEYTTMVNHTLIVSACYPGVNPVQYYNAEQCFNDVTYLFFVW